MNQQLKETMMSVRIGIQKSGQEAPGEIAQQSFSPQGPRPRGLYRERPETSRGALPDARRETHAAHERGVSDILRESHALMGSYDVLQRLNTAGGRNAPPTVCRALDFLMQPRPRPPHRESKRLLRMRHARRDVQVLFLHKPRLWKRGRDTKRENRRRPGRFSDGNARSGNQRPSPRVR